MGDLTAKASKQPHIKNVQYDMSGSTVDCHVVILVKCESSLVV